MKNPIPFVLTLSFIIFLNNLLFSQDKEECEANWNSTSTGCTVYFSDASQAATEWNWSFGDGQTSFNMNPVHTYSAAGTYNVCLVMGTPLPQSGFCFDTLCKWVTVNCATGVADLINGQSISVYPNPSNGKFTIRNENLGGNFELAIYNALGGKVYEAPYIKVEPIDISSQPSGVYFLRVESGNEIATQKLIIQ